MSSLFERLMEVAADPVATRRLLTRHERARGRRRIVAVMHTSSSDIDAWLKQIVPPAPNADRRRPQHFCRREETKNVP